MGNSCRQTDVNQQDNTSISSKILKIQSNFLAFTSSRKEFAHKVDFDALDAPKNATEFPEFYSLIPSKYHIHLGYKPIYRKLPPYKLENGDMYDGHWRMGQKCGTGILLKPDGTIMQGEWLNDNLVEGRVIYPNGDIQVGDKYIFASGVIYIGDNSFGKEIYPDGTIYEGEYVAGMKHGKGTFNFFDGASYKGDFSENQFNGYGVFRFANGSIYEGQWLFGKMHGIGVFKWTDGREYKGEFRCGYKHGVGHMKYSDGAEFMGQFEYGKRQGKAKWIEGGMPHDREFEQGHMLEAGFKHKETQVQKELNESR